MASLNVHLKPLLVAARVVGLGITFVGLLILGLHADSPTIRAFEGPRVLRESTDKVAIWFSTGELQTRQVVRGGERFHEIELDGFGTAGMPGSPAVPVQRRMVAVPPGASVSLEVELAQSVSLVGDVYPLPIPYGDPIFSSDEPGSLPVGVSERYVADDVAYASGAWTPAEVVRIADEGAWRGIEFVTLEFAPVQFQPGKRAARYVPWAQVNLTFDTVQVDKMDSLQETSRSADPLSGMIDDLFLNSSTARAWQRPPGGAFLTVDSSTTPQRLATAPENDDRWLIEVDAEGLHELSYSDLSTVLSSIGDPVTSYDPDDLHLVTGDGEPVPIWFDDSNTVGAWDPGDALYFYVPDPVSRWSEHAFYWLTLEATAGLKMAVDTAAPTGATAITGVLATHTVNPPNGYMSYEIGGSDKWIYNQATSGGLLDTPYGPGPLDFPSPPGFVSSGDVTLTLRLAPYPLVLTDKQVSATLNGTSIASNVSWSGSYPPTVWYHSVSVDSSQIQASNSLDVVVTGGVGWLDGIDLDYYRELVAEGNHLTFRYDPSGMQYVEISGFTDTTVYAFDISDPTNPVRLEDGNLAAGIFTFSPPGAMGSEYFVTGMSAIKSPVSISQEPEPKSSLRDPSNSVEYLVISPPGFISELGPLLTHRQNQGLTTLVADVTEVYKEFGDGTPNPAGIQEFVQFAYDNWGTAYLLLVGDGHYDMLDYLGTGAPNPMPPYLADVDPYIGETTTDYMFTLVDGDDEIGDLFVGRLAVNSAPETAAVVDKILAYENSPPAGDWRRRALLVADKQPDPKNAGDFHDLSDAVIANDLPYDMEVVRTYLGTATNPTDYMTTIEVRDGIIDMLNSDGALIMQYIGHGLPYALGATIWTARPRSGTGVSDVDLLENSVYPLSLTWTCWDNYHINPDQSRSSVAEAMIRAQNTGSVATFGPTGLDTVASHDVLADGFFDAWFSDGINELGQTIWRAKVYLYEMAPWHDQLLYTVMLHGDPALRLPCELYGDLNGDNTVNQVDYTLAGGDWALPDDPLGNNVTVQHLTRMTAQHGMTCAVPEP